jgi:hypothetical protein
MSATQHLIVRCALINARRNHEPCLTGGVGGQSIKVHIPVGRLICATWYYFDLGVHFSHASTRAAAARSPSSKHPTTSLYEQIYKLCICIMVSCLSFYVTVFAKEGMDGKDGRRQTFLRAMVQQQRTCSGPRGNAPLGSPFLQCWSRSSWAGTQHDRWHPPTQSRFCLQKSISSCMT